MKRLSFSIMCILIIFNTACGNGNVQFHKHSVSKYHNGSIKLTKAIKALNINVDSGNLEIYCWDNDEIRYETKHNVRGNKSKDELQVLLRKYTIKSDFNDNTIFFSVRYDKKIKKAQDYYSDIKLTIPRSIKVLNIKQKAGSILIEDRFEGNIDSSLDSVNSEIKSMKGRLNWKCDDGSFRLGAGILSGDSKVETKTGNVSVKAECRGNSQYTFKTGVGNVDLSFPSNSAISINSFGTVKTNQFTGIQGNILVFVSTKMGSIYINGY